MHNRHQPFDRSSVAHQIKRVARSEITVSNTNCLNWVNITAATPPPNWLQVCNITKLCRTFQVKIVSIWLIRVTQTHVDNTFWNSLPNQVCIFIVVKSSRINVLTHFYCTLFVCFVFIEFYCLHFDAVNTFSCSCFMVYAMIGQNRRLVYIIGGLIKFFPPFTWWWTSYIWQERIVHAREKQKAPLHNNAQAHITHMNTVFQQYDLMICTEIFHSLQSSKIMAQKQILHYNCMYLKILSGIVKMFL